MAKEEAIKEIAEVLQIAQSYGQPGAYGTAPLTKAIAERINYLITNDFSLLISILYRLDISEKKLKQLLQQTSNSTAGDIIAALIIERQLEKIKSRKAFKNNAKDIPDAERW